MIALTLIAENTLKSNDQTLKRPAPALLGLHTFYIPITDFIICCIIELNYD